MGDSRPFFGIVGGMRVLLLAVLLLLPALSHAGSVTLGCKAPTANTDSSALKTPVSYRFVMGASGSGPFPNASPVQSQCAYVWPNLAPGTYFFAATAIDASSSESVLSNVASKTVVAGLVSVGGPVLSLQVTRNSIVAPQVGTVTAGKTCDTTQAFTFAGITYNRVDVALVTPFAGLDLSQSAAWAQCQ